MPALILRIIIAAALFAIPSLWAGAAPRTDIGKPHLPTIKAASTNSESPFFYPKLLKRFMANDTSMTDEEFQFFYYGTMYQDNYDPYRTNHNPAQLEVLKPIYLKENPSRHERQIILDYATEELALNPLSLQQLAHLISVYEKNKKFDLAKIWQYKLNHILLVIASSGSGLDPETARTVVYPQHEYDFLNIAGFMATGQRFEPPHYDFITVAPKNNSPEGFYFDISEMLTQYYILHPSEAEPSQTQETETPTPTENEKP